MISRAEAIDRLLSGVAVLASKRVSVADACGRVLAEELVAARDQPPLPVSAMDGYAVRDADAAVGSVLRVIGEAPAGVPFEGRIEEGECVRIGTGGVVPDGADRIAIQEHVRREGATILLENRSESRFVRPAGGDFRSGDILGRSGQRLSPALIGLAAANGAAELSVTRQPRVLIVPSGDELVEPGAPATDAVIFNSAAYAVACLCSQWGALASRAPILPDEPQVIDRYLERAHPEFDLIVPLGGASVGERDLMRAAFERRGANLLFDRVAVVPGKPTWHARFPDGPLVVGLPGNPASAFVCAHLFVRPLLDKLNGLDPELDLITGQLTAPLPENGAREAFLRGRYALCEGKVEVLAFDRQDSSLQAPLAAANALIRRLPHAPPSEVDAFVEFLPIGGGPLSR